MRKKKVHTGRDFQSKTISSSTGCSSKRAYFSWESIHVPAAGGGWHSQEWGSGGGMEICSGSEVEGGGRRRAAPRSSGGHARDSVERVEGVGGEQSRSRSRR